MNLAGRRVLARRYSLTRKNALAMTSFFDYADLSWCGQIYALGDRDDNAD